MDIGHILDGSPEPSSLTGINFFGQQQLQPHQQQLQASGENADGDYYLPVPMTEFQRQLNEEVISLHYPDIYKLFSNNNLLPNSPELQNSLQSLFTNSQLVGTHPYLLVDHYLPPNLLLKDIPNKLSRTSGKFETLVKIIELVRYRKMEIAVISRPGKSFDIIEALLLGKMINYKRHSGSYLRPFNKSNTNYSTIHLIPSSQLDSTYFGSERFDLLLVLDQTFNINDPHITSIRSQSRNTPVDVTGSAPKLAPVVRLIPYYSAEHVTLNFDKFGNDETLYTKNVIGSMVVLRSKVGTIPNELKPYYAQGLKLLSPWLDNMSSPWPLPDLPDIDTYSWPAIRKSILSKADDIKGEDDPSKLETGNGVSSANGKDSDNVSRNNSITNEDKLFPDEDNEFYRAKRIKREHYSPSSGNNNTRRDSFSFLAPLSGSSLHRPLDDRRILTQNIVRRLEKSMNDLEIKTGEIQLLRSTTAALQATHEETIDEMSKSVNKITALKEKIKDHQRKSERQDSELSRLQEQVNKQSTELDQVKKLLALKRKQDTGNAIDKEETEQTSLDKQKEKITELEEKLKTETATTKTKDEENDYMRTEYQKASSEASDLAEKVTNLKTANEVLKTKLNIDIVRLRQESFDHEKTMKAQIILELEIKVRNVEEHLKRLIESEKQNQTRSRYSVRSSLNSNNPRRTKSPSSTNSTNNNSRRSSPSEKETGNGTHGGSNGSSHGPHPLHNMTNSL
ncbi:hypothetical protein D0Z00_000049 [Geotrichum galactomycetum]|uniref:Uncharacterized protein n=1 Tax=Geotrichum galactomycetum TaxID=27317 RepID=A0ACB6VAZ3_9ASCO|nr:hypothetical protein D0Z00_000049 [Geotrichum candidum]